MSTDNLTAAINTTTAITTNGSSGNIVNVQFKGLPGNLPNTYGNYLVVWRSQNTIPWNDNAPDGYAVIALNKSEGSQEIQVNFQVNVGYLVGYAVGPKSTSSTDQLWKNVCATAYIPASGTNIYTSPVLKDFTFDSDSVAMNFELPDGATPQTNGAWVGIWQTGAPSYTTPPIGAAAVPINSSRGGAFINGVQILRFQTYTVALFTSGWKAGAGGTNVQTAMACFATVNT